MSLRSNDLRGRKALITGASRGIGRAIAESLASAGAEVVCTSTREGGCDATLEAIRAAGGSAKALAADVADPNALKELARAAAEGGAPNILVNNAGITRDGTFLRMGAEEFDTVISVNLRAAFLLAQALVRPMLKVDAPRMIFVGSVVGLTGNAGQANYAASKAGLLGLARSLAKEFGSRGLTANVVAPGFIETDMTAGLSDDVREAARTKIPLGRLGTPEDIADMVCFLAGDSGAYVTGQALVVDGGMTL